MARLFNEFFQVDARILEIGASQAVDRGIGLRQFVFAANQPHADAPPARGAFQHDRIADAGRLASRLIQVGQQPAAGQQRHAILLGQFARAMLQSERAHLFRRRADERNAFALACLGEIGVLRQEAITRMDGLRPARPRNFQNAIRAQITFRRRCPPDAHRFVRLRHVQRSTVRLGIDRDRLDAERLQRADDAAGDGAAVRDQDFLKHSSISFTLDL